MKQLVILGFDGTIADTAPGILYCMNTTAIAMGYNPVPHEALFGVIGVSLEQGFMNIYGMKEDEIEYAISNSMEQEISSVKIGELAMEKLRGIDEVAYVRFASVYRQFKDINSFMQELNKILKER